MDSALLITSDQIYMENGCVQGTLHIEHGIIIAFYPTGAELPKHVKQLDVSGKLVLPGIIDVHSHGYHTWSAKTIDKQEIKGLSKVLPSIGVTATLATTTAWKQEEMTMLHAIADAIEEGWEGARILGIHMEGPFYHPDRHNATLREEIIPPTLEKTKDYIREGRDHVKYMTIAPEVKGALEVISWLTDHHIIAGAGHTNATSQELKAGIASGIKVSIHTGNAMRQMDRREIGALGEALLQPCVYCEIICDGFHISLDMLQIMFRIKQDLTKFIMISDSDMLSGVEPGSYEAFSKRVHVHPDGRILLDDGTISGSSKCVLYGISNLVNNLHIPLENVIPMFSLNPATLLSIQAQKGSLRIGKDADILIVDETFQVEHTFVEGRCCFQKGDNVILNEQFSSICKRLE